MRTQKRISSLFSFRDFLNLTSHWGFVALGSTVKEPSGVDKLSYSCLFESAARKRLNVVRDSKLNGLAL